VSRWIEKGERGRRRALNKENRGLRRLAKETWGMENAFDPSAGGKKDFRLGVLIIDIKNGVGK